MCHTLIFDPFFFHSKIFTKKSANIFLTKCISMSFFNYLFSKLTSNSSFFMHIFFFRFLFCYFVLKKTQFHHTEHSNFNSSHFHYISNHKNHKLYTICFIIFKVTKYIFKNSKNTNFNKFTQNAYFTLISFLSPQIVHIDSSSHITPHHYPTHHHSPPKIIKKSPKNSFFFAKF